MTVKALVLHEKDNVGTAVQPLERGETVTLALTGGDAAKVELRQPVPRGHKFALADIPARGNVIKYGETIGRATADIRAGEHAHVHNIEGLRGRGDIR